MPNQQNQRPPVRGFNAQFGAAAAGGWSDVTSNVTRSDAPTVVPPPRVQVGPQPTSTRSRAPNGSQAFREGLTPHREPEPDRRSRISSQRSERSPERRPRPTPAQADYPPPTYSASIRRQPPAPSFVSTARPRAQRPSQWTPAPEIVDLSEDAPLLPADSVSQAGDDRPLEERLADLQVSRRNRRPSEKSTKSAKSSKSKRSVYSSEGSSYSVERDEAGNSYIARRRNGRGNIKNALGYLLT